MKNILKSTLVGAAVTSAVFGGMAVTASSAEAITIKNGDTVNLNGGVTITQNNLGEYTFDFSAPATQSVGFGSSSPPFVNNDQVFLSNFTDITTGSIGAIAPFITDIDLTDGMGGTSTAVFDLLDADFSIVGSDFLFGLTGQFVAGNTTLGVGNLTLQIAHNGAFNDIANGGLQTTFSSSLTAVPTPAAVLPALFGMGTAAFRKKKRDDEELALEHGEGA